MDVKGFFEFLAGLVSTHNRGLACESILSWIVYVGQGRVKSYHVRELRFSDQTRSLGSDQLLLELYEFRARRLFVLELLDLILNLKLRFTACDSCQPPVLLLIPSLATPPAQTDITHSAAHYSPYP